MKRNYSYINKKQAKTFKRDPKKELRIKEVKKLIKELNEYIESIANFMIQDNMRYINECNEIEIFNYWVMTTNNTKAVSDPYICQKILRYIKNSKAIPLDKRKIFYQSTHEPNKIEEEEI